MQSPGPNDMKLTMVAGKAMDFAKMFNSFFAAGLRGPVHYKLDLTTPVGPSTAGGRQVLQHVRLLPPDGGPAIVMGSANGIDKTAEIRTLRALADVHAARFKGAVLQIDPAAYQELVRNVQGFFELQGFKVTLSQISPSLVPPPMAAPEPKSGTNGALIALVVVALLGLAGALLAWLRYRH
jgi:hypothetical protein